MEKKIKKPTKKSTSLTGAEKKTKKISKQKKKGFTLIELLAVIIILGILMIIAIPSVTKYINDSKKSVYVNTAKELVSGTRNLIYGGDLEMDSTDTTYYIPSDYIKTDNASKSPYGEFVKAYVAVTYDGKEYTYYWISVDDSGQGVNSLKPADNLTTDDIVSDLKSEDIENKVMTTGIGNRNNILILSDGVWSSPYQAQHYVNENGETYVGLTYEGKTIATSNSNLENKLKARCLGENVGELGVSFEKTSDNYAYVKLNNYFSNKADINLKTTVSVETDAETGDSRVVTGSCAIDLEKMSNLDVSKFLYNGEPVTRNYLEEIADNQCLELNEILENLEVECIISLINQ